MQCELRDELSSTLKPGHARRPLIGRQWLLAAVLGAGLLLAGCAMPPTQAARSQEATAVATAPAPSELRAPAPQASSTLGTQWGEGRSSPVQTVEATRITPDRPQARTALRYTDEASILQALGADAQSQLNVLLDDGKVEWAVVDGSGRALPIYTSRGGNDYQVAGRRGERYELVYTNRSQRAYVAVIAVDGLDVLTGQPGSMRSGGYLLKPGQKLRVDGFRKNNHEVAAFRFSAKEGAYASNTPAGSPANLGVIGTALFEVRLNEPTPGAPQSHAPNPFPADGSDGRYAPPPKYR